MQNALFFSAFFGIMGCLYGVGTYKYCNNLYANAVARIYKLQKKCDCVDASIIKCITKTF